MQYPPIFVFSLNMPLLYHCFFFQVHLACPKGNAGTLPSPPRAAARAAPPLPSGAADQRVAWSPRHVYSSFSQIPGTQLLCLPECIKYTPQSGTCTENDNAAKLEFFKPVIYILHTRMRMHSKEWSCAFLFWMCSFAPTNHLHELHMFLRGSVHTWSIHAWREWM